MLEVINPHDRNWYRVIHISSARVEFITKDEISFITIEQANFRFRNKDESIFFLGKIRCE